jgi:MoxR-like ATPase
VSYVVDSRTESRDLLWYFDAVARLADAQLFGALGGIGVRLDRPGAPVEDREQRAASEPHTAVRGMDALEAVARERLAVSRYVQPRALWWAFDWRSAERQARSVGVQWPIQPDEGDPRSGVLVLIDEIDKAESDVPNGLLEALGAGSFTPLGRNDPVTAVGEPPLVIITTNEERTLPDAFLRRCLVLHLRLPEKREELVRHLMSRAAAHFPKVQEQVLRRAAELLVADREKARREHWLPLPGQAEYLDLVRAVAALSSGDGRKRLTPEQIMDRVEGFVLKKHPEAIAGAEGGVS